MLLYILLLVVVMAGISVLILKVTFRMISTLGHKYIEKTHKSAEFIMETGQVPPFWFKREITLPVLGKLICLRRIRKLISYFKNSTIAGEEGTRALIVSKLTRIHNDWTDLEWDDLSPRP